MTIAKDFASKFAVAFVAAAMILSAIAPAVQAAEADDLQTTINDLLAQVADLQDQLHSKTALSLMAKLSLQVQLDTSVHKQRQLLLDGKQLTT
jgi:hypothetical protein